MVISVQEKALKCRLKGFFYISLLLFASKGNGQLDSTDQSSHTLTRDVLMLSIISKHFVFQINLPVPSCGEKTSYVQLCDSQKSKGEYGFFPFTSPNLVLFVHFPVTVQMAHSYQQGAFQSA